MNTKIVSFIAAILLFATSAFADTVIHYNETSDPLRRVPILLLDSADGITPIDSATITGNECTINFNGVTGESVCAGAVTEVASGIYSYQMTIAEAGTLGYFTIRISDTGSAALTYYGQGRIVAYNPYSAEQFIPARGTAQAASSATIRLAAIETFADDELNYNTAVHIVSAASGAGQTRCIVDYEGATDTAAVEPWTTTPTGTITYSLIASPHCDALQPTTSFAKLDVNNTGTAGVDWGNVDNKTTTNALTGTTVSSSQVAASVTGAVGSVTGNVGGTINGLTATALKDFFDTNSAATYGTAVAGSVVSEIATNCSGGGGGGSCTNGGWTEHTAQAVTISTVKLAADDTYYQNAIAENTTLYISSATVGRGQSQRIGHYSSATNTVTLTKPFIVKPTGTVKYVLIPETDLAE